MNTLDAFKVTTTSQTLRVADIDANPINPRKVAEKDRAELAESLKAVGQMHRIWVRPHPEKAGRFELVDGERRWWGAKSAKLETLEANVGNWTDEQVVIIAFTTGTGAKTLSPIAEARGLKWLKDHTKASVREIAERVGVSHMTVQNAVAVMEGPAEVIDAVETQGLPVTTAVVIVSIEDRVNCLAALAKVMAPVLLGHSPLSVAATKSLIKAEFAKPRPAPVVTADQVALSAAESLKVFPAGATDPEPESGFVAYTRPIPADLLKPEVVAGASIKFADVAEGAVVYVGVDESGKSVPLVKVAEALAAVKPDDRHIFREDVARGAGIPKPERAAGEPPSRRVEEEAAERERKKAEKAQRKKDKAVVTWLRELRKALMDSDATGGIPFWTLLFDHALEALGDEDIALLLMAEDAPKGSGENSAGDLSAYAGELPLAQLVALVTQMLLVPSLRTQGVDTVLVKDWHEAVIAPPKPTEPEAVAFQSLPPEEAKRCTEIAKAHAAGMSVPKIAREFSATVAEICGMLEIDEPSVMEEWQALGDALTAAREKAGVSVRAFAPMIKLQLGRDVQLCDLIPEELTKLLEAMDRIAASKAGKSVEPQL